MVAKICEYCGAAFEAQRTTRRFCSQKCAMRAWRGFPRERACRLCGKAFSVLTAGDANRKYCSQRCSKKANTKRVQTWKAEHPGVMSQYNKSRLVKNPGAWKDKHNQERSEAIRLLGGACVVCGVTNPNWLHIDYIPTTRDKPYRHPRHLRFIRAHLSEFRLLCANHHYELTLTRRIEGTDITQ